MKLFNIFKKETSKEVKNNIQKMDKNQLSKVIGGADVTFVIDDKKKGINAMNVG